MLYIQAVFGCDIKKHQGAYSKVIALHQITSPLLGVKILMIRILLWIILGTLLVMPY
jgi:hypothetical protein